MGIECPCGGEMGEGGKEERKGGLRAGLEMRRRESGYLVLVIGIGIGIYI